MQILSTATYVSLTQITALTSMCDIDMCHVFDAVFFPVMLHLNSIPLSLHTAILVAFLIFAGLAVASAIGTTILG